MHEKTAQRTGNLFGGKKPLRVKAEFKSFKNASILDFFIPITTLVVATITGLLYTGGYSLFGGGTLGLIEAFQHGNISLVLLIAGSLSVASSLAHILLRRTMNYKEVAEALKEGLTTITPSIMMLCLAWTFSSLLANDLQTGQYLAGFLVGSVPRSLLLFMFFIVSLIVTIAVGSSWGAMSLMTALSIPMVISFLGIVEGSSLDEALFIIPVIGSIFSGAIAGNTFSPIADAPIMASTSTGTYLMDHVKTQFSYSIPPLIGTSVAYLFLGYLQRVTIASNMAALLIGAICSLLVLSFLNRKT